MKENCETISMHLLCSFFGISRQAYYQHEWSLTEELFQIDLVVEAVKDIRTRHPRIGVRKLQSLLHPFFTEHSIKMGRDALFTVLSAQGLLVRNRKRHIRTTNSFHWLRKYSNLIIDFTPQAPGQLWVSDITYWKTGGNVFYISLITDAYSRKIVGYHLSDSLHAEETLKSLEMALRDRKLNTEKSASLIHHSDRGVQYCSFTYIKKLKKHHIQISMTQSGDPLENAMAERVNGIIKDEYLLNYQCYTLQQAREKLTEIVSLYNKERPHSSIGNFTPEYVHFHYNTIDKEQIKKLWKNYYTKKDVTTHQF